LGIALLSGFIYLYYKLALHSITWENTPEAAIGAYNNLACSYLDKGDINNAENCILNYAIPYALKKIILIGNQLFMKHIQKYYERKVNSELLTSRNLN